MSVNILTLRGKKYSANSELDEVKDPTVLGFQSVLFLQMHLILGRCSIPRVLAHRPTKLPTGLREQLFSELKDNILKFKDFKIGHILTGV